MSVDDNRVLELYGFSPRHGAGTAWPRIVSKQRCPFADARCFKVRKSQPEVSIGTCSVRYGAGPKDIVICPNRLLERKQVFFDCIHLLSQHEPGNELHVVPEVSVPGGSVDYFLVSARNGMARDFVGVEFQTLDTTGTVWPERQRLLRSLGLRTRHEEVASGKGFGMNWKMTAKTILVQFHHKVDALEHIGKRLALVLQDHLLAYLRREFRFEHIRDVRIGDTMHIHAYRLQEHRHGFRLELGARISTDAAGVAKCLGIQAETKVDLETILAEVNRKMSSRTVLTLEGAATPVNEGLPGQ